MFNMRRRRQKYREWWSMFLHARAKVPPVITRSCTLSVSTLNVFARTKQTKDISYFEESCITYELVMEYVMQRSAGFRSWPRSCYL